MLHFILKIINNFIWTPIHPLLASDVTWGYSLFTVHYMHTLCTNKLHTCTISPDAHSYVLLCTLGGGYCTHCCSPETIKTLMKLKIYCIQRKRGQWAVYYTSPQSFIITFSYLLAQQLWGLLLNYDLVECPNI